MPAHQRIAGQPVPATEQAEPAAQGEFGDADRRAAAGWDGPPALVQCVVDLGQPRAHPRPPPSVDVDRDGIEAAEVEHQSLVEERPAKQCPPPRGTTCVPVTRA